MADIFTSLTATGTEAELIKVAAENNCTNVAAILLDYKNKNFSDFDPMDEFTLSL